MKNKLFIRFWNRKNVIQLRVTINKKKIELGSTGLKVHNNWCAKAQKFTGEHNAPMNAILLGIENKLLSIFYEFENHDKRISLNEFKLRYKGDDAPLFADIFDKFLKSQKTKLSKSTINTYRIKGQEFLKLYPDINVPDINSQVIKSYIRKLTSKKNLPNRLTTATKKAQLIKTVILWAVEEELITSNPLQNFGVKLVTNINLEHLTREEVGRLFAYKFGCTLLKKVTLYYLFSCFTGFGYAELRNFSMNQIIEKDGRRFIVGKRKKTNTSYFVPVFEETEKILSEMTLPVTISNQVMNRVLKEVMAVVGINRRIWMHTGRKTFANWLINDKGFSLTATAYMMGQKSEKELKPYAEVTSNRVISEINKLENEYKRVA